MLPTSLRALASGESSIALTTIGGYVRLRVFMMNAALAPLPEPGAPPRRMISFGKRRLSRPNSASRSCQTDSKINWASFISRSLSFSVGGFMAIKMLYFLQFAEFRVHTGIPPIRNPADERGLG